MEIKFGKAAFRLDYSFIILISFAVLYNYKDTLKIIAFSLLHEIGHLLALFTFGVRPYSIELSFYGVGLKYENYLSKIKEFTVIICGPAVNLILFLIFRDEVNFLLFIINVLPIYPLDGGRLVKLFLPKAERIVTIILLIILICLSVFLFIEFKIFTLLLITIYLVVFNFKEFDNPFT